MGSYCKIGLLVLWVLSVDGFLIKTPSREVDVITRQKNIVNLLVDLGHALSDPESIEAARSCTFEGDLFTNEEAVEDFLTVKENGFLPQKEIFSIVDPKHKHQYFALFKVLYHAKDYDTFFKCAAWARDNVNESLFYYSFVSAVQLRNDTKRFMLPAPYEVYPIYFTTKNGLETVVSLNNTPVLDVEDTPEKSIRFIDDSYLIDVDYTAPFYENDNDSKLAYFREDIGLNAYYFYFRTRYPYFNEVFMHYSKFGDYWFYFHQQLLARYNLERLTNGLPTVNGISWDEVIEEGYDPMLIHPNGNSFAGREDNFNPTIKIDTEVQTYLKEMEKLLRDYSNGVYLLGDNVATTDDMLDLIHRSNYNGYNYEETCRYVLGTSRNATEKNLPGLTVLEHFETNLRDPVFWKLQKHIVDYYNTMQNGLPSYSVSQLNFPGVNIYNIVAEKILTFYDYYTFDLKNMNYNNIPETTSKLIKIGQPRLNHKPFVINIELVSLKYTNCRVKIFIGPKYDEMGKPLDLNTNRHNFVEIDSFYYALTLGINTIKRKSETFKRLSGDLSGFDTLFEKVGGAEYGNKIFEIQSNESYSGYPSRLLIPKGTEKGIVMQIFVIIYPMRVTSESYEETDNFGYPFDRSIDGTSFYQPNMFTKDILIYHKSNTKVLNYGPNKTSKSWYSAGAYDYESKKGGGKGEFDYKGKENFDYASKKQYNYSGKNDFDYKTANKFDYQGKEKTDYAAIRAAKTTTEPIDLNTENDNHVMLNNMQNTSYYDINTINNDLDSILTFENTSTNNYDKDINNEIEVIDKMTKGGEFVRMNKSSMTQQINEVKSKKTSQERNYEVNDMYPILKLSIMNNKKKSFTPTYRKEVTGNKDKTNDNQMKFGRIQKQTDNIHEIDDETNEFRNKISELQDKTTHALADSKATKKQENTYNNDKTIDKDEKIPYDKDAKFYYIKVPIDSLKFD